MEHKLSAESLIEQEKGLNLHVNGVPPSMYFIEKVQVASRIDGLFLVRLFSQAPLSSKEEFRYICTREFLKQFMEVLDKQMGSDSEYASSPKKERSTEGTKKKPSE